MFPAAGAAPEQLAGAGAAALPRRFPGHGEQLWGGRAERCRAAGVRSGIIRENGGRFPSAERWDLNVKLFFGLFSAGFFPLCFSSLLFLCVQCTLGTF